MIDKKSLEKAICRIVASVTGLPVTSIYAGDPNTGAVDGSYCVVRLQNPINWGQAMKSQRDVVAADDPQYMDIIDQTRTQLDLSFSVNFYRDNAISYASALLEANKRIPVKTILRTSRMGWIRTTAVNNLTGLFSGNQEERAQLDVHVYHEDLVEDRVNRIYRVEYAVEDANLNVLAQGQVNGLSG